MKNIFNIALFLMAIILSSSAMAAKINKINVRGNKRIEQSTIVDYLNVRVGDHYSEAKKNEMIKNLYATSLFETINIAFHKGALKVSVQETPFISRVVFAGNYKVRTKILLNEIYTAPGESLRKAKIRTDVEKIKEIYKRSGRFSVHVSSKIEPLENNRVKVIFEIDEGPKTGIKNIYFAGNSHYKDSELKSIVLTKESRWFRFLETNDTYDPDRIEFDKQLLKRFYNSVGFADFRVISVTSDLLPTKEGFALTYSIEEGEKYKFGKITINNKLDTIDDSEVLKFVDAKKEGETFNLSAMQRMAEKVSKYLGGKGYPQVEVHPEVTPNRASGTVDVVIVVDQASKIFINKINIEGNLKTEDSVIRRQLQIAEGDVFNRSKLERGQRNIRNLDYFGKFNLGMSQTKKQDRYDINIDVEEKSTASFGFDLGYNTTGGMFGKISFLERNLIGSGRQFNAGVQIGKKSTHYYTGLTDPSFLGKDLSLGGTLFKSDDGTGSGFENGKQNYSSSTIGTRINLGYNITDDLFHGIEYGIKKSELKAPGKTASIFIKEQMGKFVTSEISHSLTYDKTDSRILPKNGYLLTAEQAFAGIGGDTNYLKHELSGKAFKSFVDNKYTLKFSAAGGHIKGLKGKKVRIPDRFTVGDYNLRGFASGGIGPRDVATKESINGQKYYTLSTELSFPLGLPEEFNMTGSIFIDAGALWDADSTAATSKGLYNTKTLRSSYGFGVLWITRIAPIRLDWGFPIKKEKFDETQVFHIRFSTHL